MKKLLLLFISLSSVTSLMSQDIIGDWNGILKVGLVELPLVFHVEKDTDGFAATMDSPSQGAKGMTVTKTSFADNELSLAMDNIGASYKGQLIGDSIVGVFTQGQNFPLTLKRGEVQLNRPQEPKPPFTYQSEDITFLNEDANINLAGRFTYPQQGNNFPVVILISGSGPQDRNEELMGHKPFLLLSNHLTNNGIAVLRFDDRGVGESKGDFGKATTKDFATDVLSAVEYLKTRKEIDTDKIGLLGHSEGGIIAVIVAAEHAEDISFVVSMAGVGVDMIELSKMQSKNMVLAEGISEEIAIENQELAMKVIEVVLNNTEEYLKSNIEAIMKDILPVEKQTHEVMKNLSNSIARVSSPWMREFLQYKPQEDLNRVKAHVFALNGDKDQQVDADVNLEAIGTNLINAKSKKIKKYTGLNHLFQTATTGALSEYSKIEETMSPVVLKDISDWIKEVTKR